MKQFLTLGFLCMSLMSFGTERKKFIDSEVSFVDTQSPVITCPDNIFINNDAGICDAIVDFMDATAIDDTDPNPTVTQTAGPVSGSTFSLGNTDVTFMATDAAGNVSTCTFTVTVIDSEGPNLMCPATIIVDNDPGTCGAVVTYDTITITDNCSEPTMTEETLTTGFAGGNGSQGNMFDVNILNDITVKSFDVNLVEATGDFEVYFKNGSYTGSEQSPEDWTLVGAVTGVVSTGPNMATPLDLNLSVLLEAGMTYAFYVTSTGADVDYTNGTVEGDVLVSSADIEILEGRGNEYPFMDHFSPRNFNGNIIYTTGGYGVSMTTGMISGSQFPVGTTTVTYEVTDESGNIGTCSFDVIVNDIENPLVFCPDEQLVDGDQNDVYELPEYSLIGLVLASDNCPDIVITQSPVPGSFIGLGTTNITITASDASGNFDVCNFDVVVNELLGVASNNLENVSMFPNPASSLVTVTANVKSLEVYTILGQLVLASTTNSFDVSELNSGNYIVDITNNEGSKTMKLIVE